MLRESREMLDVKKRLAGVREREGEREEGSRSVWMEESPYQKINSASGLRKRGFFARSGMDVN